MKLTDTMVETISRLAYLEIHLKHATLPPELSPEARAACLDWAKALLSNSAAHAHEAVKRNQSS